MLYSPFKTNNVIYASGGNSNQWNTAFSAATAYRSLSGTFVNTATLSALTGLLTPLTLTNTLTSQLVTNTTFTTYKTNVAASTATLLPTSIYQNASGNWQNVYTFVSIATAGTLNLNKVVSNQLSSTNLYTNYLSTNNLYINSLTANAYFGTSTETVFTDGSSLSGNGDGTLTLNYTNGIYANSPFSVSSSISSNDTIYAANGNSNQWNTAYSLVSGGGSLANYVTNAAFSAYQTNVAASTATLLPTSIYQNASGNWQNAYNNAIFTINGTANQITATQTTTSPGSNAYTLSLPSNVNVTTINVLSTLNVAGSAYFYNTTNLNVSSNIIYFGEANTGNALDLGLVAHFTDANNNRYQHTGIARKAGQGSPGVWTLFSGLTTEPGSNLNWNDPYLTVDTLSANLLGNLSGNYVTVGNGNSNQWNTAYSLVSGGVTSSIPQSGVWNTTTATVSSLSANWNNTYSSVSGLSANWNNSYTTVAAYSASWVTTTRVLTSRSLTADYIYGSTPESVFTDGSNLSGNGNSTLTLNYLSGVYVSSPIYYGGFNSNLWNSVYTNVSANSAAWSSGGGGGGNTSLQNLSGNWQSTYNTVSSLSSNWNNAYALVSGGVTSSIPQSGTWNTTAATVSSLSSSWNNTYYSVSSLSASWNNTYYSVSSLSSNWNNTYYSVSSLSSNWNNTYYSVSSLSASWSNAYYSVTALSGNWNTAYSLARYGTYLPLSGGAITGAVTTTSTISSANTITANNIATQNQVQFLSAGVLKVYQYYNSSTNSLDTIFV